MHETRSVIRAEQLMAAAPAIHITETEMRDRLTAALRQREWVPDIVKFQFRKYYDPFVGDGELLHGSVLCYWLGDEAAAKGGLEVDPTGFEFWKAA